MQSQSTDCSGLSRPGSGWDTGPVRASTLAAASMGSPVTSVPTQEARLATVASGSPSRVSWGTMKTARPSSPPMRARAERSHRARATSSGQPSRFTSETATSSGCRVATTKRGSAWARLNQKGRVEQRRGSFHTQGREPSPANPRVAPRLTNRPTGGDVHSTSIGGGRSQVEPCSRRRRSRWWRSSQRSH